MIPVYLSNTAQRSSDFSGSLIIIERITSVPSLRSILSIGSKTEAVKCARIVFIII